MFNCKVLSATIFFQQAGGRGGYGNSNLRELAKVVQEVRNGIISLQEVRKDNGGVLSPEAFEVNFEETKKLSIKEKSAIFLHLQRG